MLCYASAGHVAKGRPPAQLVVAGVLAAYAAQLRAAADFSPAWPQAFPEHLRTGSGRMSASKARSAAQNPATLQCLLFTACPHSILSPDLLAAALRPCNRHNRG